MKISMWAVSYQRPELLCIPRNGFPGRRLGLPRIAASWTIKTRNKDFGSFQSGKKEELPPIRLPAPSIPQSESKRSSDHSDLRFNRLQVPEKELIDKDKFEFGQYVAREAVIDEEYWTAAWMRAESHFEDRPNERYVENLKKKFCDQEFNAMKQRRTSLHGQKCKCIITVRKEVKNVKCNVIKSVVATLDLSIRCLLPGETFPGEKVRAPPPFCSIDCKGPNTYGYVSNLVVALFARRRGIARNMMHFAIQSAKASGVERVYVHVHRNNTAAQDLYEKMGFEIVEMASSQLLEQQLYLLGLSL